MLKCFSLLIFCVLTVFWGPSALAGWELSFSDEFNGGGLDKTVWKTKDFWGNQVLPGNNEQQCYVDDVFSNQSSGNNQVLRITARKGSKSSCHPAKYATKYLSGMITTAGCNQWENNSYCQNLKSFTQKYGYFEMRAKFPAGKGFWPAFWLLPKNGSWPPEIDIIEWLGHQKNRAYMTYHYPDSAGNYLGNFHKDYIGPDFSAGFHTFGIDWQPDRMIWYIDGVERARYEGKHVPQEPMYLLANLAVGGYWPGNPDSTTPFPAHMDIDHIRVYKRVNNGEPDTLPPAGPPSGGSTPPAASELIDNAGFESGLNDWRSAWGNGSASSEKPRTGSRSLRIQSSGTVEQKVNGLKPNTKYTLTAYINSDGGTANLGVKNYGGSDRRQISTARDYTKLSISFTTGASSTSAIVYLYGHSGKVFADDFELTQGASTTPSPPSTPSPPPAANAVISNPGFENGLNAWRSAWGDGAASSEKPRSGSGSLRILSGGTVEQKVNGLKPNTKYTLTAYINSDGGTANLGVKNYGSYDKRQSSSARDYTKLSLSFTTGASNTSATVYLYGHSGKVFADDFVLEEH